MREINQHDFFIVIPAFNPDVLLIQTIEDIQNEKKLSEFPIIIVNDGSSSSALFSEKIFSSPQIKVLNHERNLGKGAAIKTAVKWIEENCPEVKCIITVDADYQHRAADILQVLMPPSAEDFVIGYRHFSLRHTPLRSYVGNQISRVVVFVFSMFFLKDTQSGLRRYPKRLFHTLRNSPYDRYEFEVKALLDSLDASRKPHFVPIGCHYIANNKSSHFKVIQDSVRIYGVILWNFIDKVFNRNPK